MGAAKLALVLLHRQRSGKIQIDWYAETSIVQSNSTGESSPGVFFRILHGNLLRSMKERIFQSFTGKSAPQRSYTKVPAELKRAPSKAHGV
jgi:hypothetical protein